MRKVFRFIFFVFPIFLLTFSSCGNNNNENHNHNHLYSEWVTTKKPECTESGLIERYCSCGKIEKKTISPLGHTEVIDKAVAPTCAETGLTEGIHCSVCNKILVVQKVVNTIGHNFDNGTIIKNATCIQEGTKKYTCTNSSCTYSYTEKFTLPQYTATELYDQSIKYVGEITTYDKNGKSYALGTGFVISADGKVVTNYHVLEGAYSAKIVINGKSYNIVSVLAYDENIDLAVVKINGNNLTAAKVCKYPVKVGETVYAIGSSRGMTNTYSQGIVTYADREVDGVSHVQHDASITNGNSGGPLINAYGEVIGINTWGISNSQNLNFAVFTGELDNLKYGTPLTISQFYLKECNVYEKLKNYIMTNGKYNSSDKYYYITLNTSYSSDYESKYTRKAYYYVDDDCISLDCLINDGEYWAYFYIDDKVDGSYSWYYFDDMDSKMSGTLYASSFKKNSLLSYSSNNISSSSLRNSVRELASSMISFVCSYIDEDLSDINVTAKDLGFNNY